MPGILFLAILCFAVGSLDHTKSMPFTARSRSHLFDFRHCFIYQAYSQGREALNKTTSTAKNELNLDVIYGDTDSIMIDSHKKDLGVALSMADQVKKKITGTYKCMRFIYFRFFFAQLYLLFLFFSLCISFTH
jgi:hypothetical protein